VYVRSESRRSRGWFVTVLLCRNLQKMGVSLGGESVFGKVHKTPTFEHFTVEPELVQST